MAETYADTVDTLDEPRTDTAKPASETDELKEDRDLAKKKLPDLGKHALRIWRSWDDRYARLNAELRVNFLRYKGVKNAIVHPKDQTRIWAPKSSTHFSARSFNRIERGCDIYVSQVMADDPVMQGVPKSQEDEDLDAAQAASEGVMSEWLRLELNDITTEGLIDASWARSIVLHAMWNPRSAGTKPAQMYFTDPETGEKRLDYVDQKGEKSEKDGAAQVWMGNIEVEKLLLFHVRCTEGVRYIHDAPEILIGRLVPLRKVFEMYPELEEEELSKLLGSRPEGLENYLEDYSGEGKRTTEQIVGDTGSFAALSSDTDRNRLLDSKVFFLVYYRAKDRTYRDGYWCHVFGSGCVPEKGRGTLRKWGRRPPVAHLRFMYDSAHVGGRSLVDVLRHKQDAIDFVETQVMNWIKSMKARFAVHALTVVNKDQLRSEQDDIVYYSGPTAPGQLQPAQMPPSLTTWHERWTGAFSDDLGVHGVSRGLHVPGVQSGAHVEALQAADQTILALTRKPMIAYFRQLSRVILAGMKGYWKEERLVSLYGKDRPYVARAFSATDFGDTEDVVLSAGSFLMLTPSQRSQIMVGLVETGAFSPEEIRRNMPTQDVGGFELRESPFYQRARRENELFLAGPPEKLQAERRKVEKENQRIQDSLARVMERANMAMTMGDQFGQAETQRAIQEIQAAAQAVSQRWSSTLAPYLPEIMPFETGTGIGQVHADEHFRALSRSRAERIRSRFPWWYGAFLEHAMAHMPPQQAPAQPAAAPEQGQPAAPPPQPAAVA